MPRPAVSEEKRQETRRRILRAATELYRTGGEAEVSVRAIAERAGISVGTFYQYFENFRELMKSLWGEPVSDFLRELQAISDQTTDPRNHLHRLLDAYIEFATEDLKLFRGAFLYVRPEADEKPPLIAPEDDPFFSALHYAIVEGQKAGVFRKGDATKMTHLVWASLHGSLALPINMDGISLNPPEQLVKNMRKMLLEWLETV